MDAVAVSSKKAILRPFLKKSNVVPDDENNPRSVANMLFLLSSSLVANQLQALSDDTDFQDLFQCGLKSGYGTETILQWW